MYKNIYKIIIFIFLIMPFTSSASTIYFDPENIEVGPDSSFVVNVKIDTEECVNVVDARISFDKKYLKLRDFLTGTSIVDLWIEKPNELTFDEINDNGQISFAGGIPGGYCGVIPGDPGRSNIVAELIFDSLNFDLDIKKEKISEIVFVDDSQVLLNDGLGSVGELSTKKGIVNISKEIVPVKDTWRDIINKDNIPPEPFIVELYKNSKVYNDQYYITFHTADKQTGVDYYEVLEIRPGEKIGQKKKRNVLSYLGIGAEMVGWKRAQTPYLLEDQSIKSVIKVRAIDKSGNERIVEYIPPTSTKTNFNIYYIISLLVLFAIIIFLIRKFILQRYFSWGAKHKKTYEEEIQKNLD